MIRDDDKDKGNERDKKIREKRIYIQPLVDLTPQKTNDAAKAAGNANQKTKEVTKITEEQQRIIDEKKRLFKKSKKLISISLRLCQ